MFILETCDMTKDRNSESRKTSFFLANRVRTISAWIPYLPFDLSSLVDWISSPCFCSYDKPVCFFPDPNVISKFESQCTSAFLKAVVCSIAEPLSPPYSPTERKTLLTLLNLITTYLLNGLLTQWQPAWTSLTYVTVISG